MQLEAGFLPPSSPLQLAPQVSSLENTVSLTKLKRFFFLPDLMGSPGSERFDNFPQGHTAEAWEIKRDSKAYVL